MKLAAVRDHALALPEVTGEPHFNYGSFRVRGKIFVTVPPDGQHVHVFLPEEPRELALRVHAAFAEKLSWGAKVIGLRITLAKAQPAAVRQLIRLAWQTKAP